MREHQGGQTQLLPLQGRLFHNERALRQVDGDRGNGVTVRVDDIGQRHHVVKRRDVRVRARDRVKASEGGERLHRKNVELRAGRIPVLDQLPAADLTGDRKVLGGDSPLDCVLPLGKAKADGDQISVRVRVRV